MSELERITAERDALRAETEAREITRAFQSSAFMRDGFTAPAGMVEATFRKHFTVENGAVVAREPNGATMLAADFSGPARFDDALRTLVARSGFGDQILKAGGASGSGAGSSNPKTGTKSMSRAAFEAMSPADRMAHIRAGGTLHN